MTILSSVHNQFCLLTLSGGWKLSGAKEIVKDQQLLKFNFYRTHNQLFFLLHICLVFQTSGWRPCKMIE